ncbi:putative glycosyltransferase EpsJ [Stieleria bergensis]|uniref:Putative glycosyltransferase EpsJ n=1 Tax=Stieleria bergensis TaxID=2528025 RepID=A0A517SXD4_9BACT|nr:putative glycosyltransferase EpsJ [Planctomycetes bacterium SV_7m_r]
MMSQNLEPTSDFVPGMVSTIIPVYNRKRLLVEAAESVLSQCYQSIELIIVDDGSRDRSYQTAKQLQSRFPELIKVLRQANRGVGVAREHGRRYARGEFIQYLDSDDLLVANKFRDSVQLMRDRPELGAVYGWIKLRQADGSELDHPYKCSGVERASLFPWLLSDRWWNTNAPLWRRSVCDQIGPWSSLRWSQDWEYDARAASRGVQLGYLPQYVTIQRQHNGRRQSAASRWTSRQRIDNRVQFFEALWEHAQVGQISEDNSHRQHFARWAFATARSAAFAGHGLAAARLMRVAYGAAGKQARVARGFELFDRTRRMFGNRIAGRIWKLAGKVKPVGRFTLQESFTNGVQ